MTLFIVYQYLRYLCELDWVHPEDAGRKFVMSYSLADGSIKIGEVPRRNSGIREGTFLKSMKLETPESDPNFPTYFTPDRFYIGKFRSVIQFGSGHLLNDCFHFFCINVATE